MSTRNTKRFKKNQSPYRLVNRARPHYYGNTKLDQRLKDEETDEPLPPALEEWIEEKDKDPLFQNDNLLEEGLNQYIEDLKKNKGKNGIGKYDIPGIDDNFNKQYAKLVGRQGYNLDNSGLDKYFNQLSNDPNSDLPGNFTIKLLDSKGNIAGRITYTIKGGTLEISGGRIEPNHRGKGFFPYIRRELMNVADKYKLKLKTYPLAWFTVEDNKMKQDLRKSVEDYILSSDKFKYRYDFETVKEFRSKAVPKNVATEIQGILSSSEFINDFDNIVDPKDVRGDKNIDLADLYASYAPSASITKKPNSGANYANMEYIIRDPQD